MTDDTRVVPFGKYKGQPVEVLAADKSYCDWLAGQDWFRDRYTTIHTLIVNNFREPSETPEHNALQARFLDPDWRVRFIVARRSHEQLQRDVRGLYDTVLKHCAEHLTSARTQLAREQQRDLAAEWQQETERRRASVAYHVKAVSSTNRPYGAWPEMDQQHLANARKALEEWTSTRTEHLDQQRAEQAHRVEQFQAAITELEQQQAEVNRLRTRADYWFECDTDFEVEGADVVLTAVLYPEKPNLEKWRTGFPIPVKADTPFYLERELTYRIECKPSLGDDYPAVLRQMRAAKTDSLVIGTYTGTGATLDQVREVFGMIRILTVAEVLAVEVTGLVTPGE
jgi:hypothetical protein